jgi:hypothetical protein
MKSLMALSLALSTALLAACGGGDTEDRLDVRDPVVRFVDAAPASGNLTLYSGDTAQADASNFAFKSTSHYYDVGTGNATWSVRPAANSASVLATANLDPQRGNRYTFVALPAASASATSLMVIQDPYNKGLSSDKARLRFVNAAAATPSVDVYVLTSTQDLSSATPTFGNLGFGSALPASGNDSYELAGGAYRLVLTAPGTKTVLFNATNVTLGNNADWLLTLIPGTTGLPGDLHVLLTQGNGDQDGHTQELLPQ